MSGLGFGPDISLSDRAVVAGQLGRTPRGLTGIATRCPFAYPAVVESMPVLAGGAPNPTLLYVTCPSLAAVISRAEAAGGVRRFRSEARSDPGLRTILEELTRIYQRRRKTLHDESETRSVDDTRLEAGIGGSKDAAHASCLHAYAAAMQAIASGWLEVDESGVVERVRTVWERFLPPVEQAWCDDRRCAKWRVGERRAVIDVGTISVRLLVADIVDGKPWALVRKAEVTRLGQDLRAGGALSVEARARTAEVVGEFADEARLLGVDEITLAGTSATRDAGDGLEFVDGLARDYSLKAKILSGKQEAELAYAGASLDVSDPVVLDVGGGSTELVTGLEGGPVIAESMQLGASRATEKWIQHDPPTADELDEVESEAVEAVARERECYGAAMRGREIRRLVGVAGTVTTLAALSAGIREYDSATIHLRRMTLEEIRDLLTRLAGLTTEQRAALPCVQAGRAPVIVAGAAIVAAVMEALGYEELTVSERDLLDGLIIADS